jgi:hypothetical protein
MQAVMLFKIDFHLKLPQVCHTIATVLPYPKRDYITIIVL